MFVITSAQGVVYGPYTSYLAAKDEITGQMLASPKDSHFWHRCEIRVISKMPVHKNGWAA